MTDSTQSDARAMRDAHGDALFAAVVWALPGWVERCVRTRVDASGSVVAEEADAVAELIDRAARSAVDDAESRLATSVRQLPGVDGGPPPLQVLRSLVVHPTAALAELGVPEVVRGEFEERAFPDDVYDLSPATWADIDPALHELGLTWSAATAFLHKQLRQG